nr:MAG TPA: Polynucleotide kinase 3 phosphatase [Caudoviricetes sp.]
MAAEAKIKIGLDFHGVINENPVYFKEFTSEAFARGWEIHVVTGGPYAKVVQKLNEWGIRYTKVFAIFDFYNRKGLAEVRPDGEFKIDSNLWDTAKAKYCKSHHISMHIDDSKIYERDFSTPYCIYNAEQRFCELKNGCVINLEISISETLDEIENFLNGKCP